MLPRPGELALLPCPHCHDILLWTPAHTLTHAGAYRCVNGHSNPPCVVCGSYHTEANRDPASATLTVLCSDCGQRFSSSVAPSSVALHPASG
jgi:hypothetical protein